MLMRLNAVLEGVDDETRRCAPASSFEEEDDVSHEFVGLRFVESSAIEVVIDGARRLLSTSGDAIQQGSRSGS